MFKENIIGEKAEIIYNTKRFNGLIIDETKNTIIMLVNQKKKVFLKQRSFLKINNHNIEKKIIQKRLEDRIK